jgi:hypothetical protein
MSDVSAVGSYPYRDACPIDDSEPMPTFDKDEDRRGFVILTALLLLVTLAFAVLGRTESALATIVLCGPSIVLVGTVNLLQKPVREWRSRRYARRVARGVAALEAKAAAI